jgi:hypothetical protein
MNNGWAGHTTIRCRKIIDQATDLLRKLPAAQQRPMTIGNQVVGYALLLKGKVLPKSLYYGYVSPGRTKTGRPTGQADIVG